jgi:tetratricopeptide (TPR) repeat protein
MKAFLKKEGAFLLILFLFALGLRMIYLSQLQGSPMFDAPIMDGKYHHEWVQLIRGDWSKAILEGVTLHPDAPYFRAPLYAYSLAVIFAIFENGFLAARILQFLIGSLSVVLIYFLGKRVFSPAAGRIAALLAAVYGPFIYFEGELLIPVVLLFLTLLVVLAVLATERKPSWLRWLGCGALLGLAAAARPNVLIFLTVLIPWMLVRLRSQKVPWRRSLGAVLVLLVGAVLLMVPVHVHNYRMSKEFLPTMVSQGGVNFFIGNNRDADGSTAIVPGTRATWWGGYYDAVQLAEEAEGRTLKASEVSAYWFQRGLEFMRDEPDRALRLMAKKLAMFWSGIEIANNKDIYFFSARRPLLKVLLWPGTVFCPFGIVAPLALAGMIMAWRRREGRGTGLLVLLVCAYMATVVLFFVNARFRLPVVPLLLPFAGYLIAALWGGKRLSRIILPLVLILIFGVLVNANLARVPLPSRAESFNSLGSVYLGKNMYGPAKEQFRQALEADPQYVRAMSGLARTHDRTDSTAQAIIQWERAVAISPEMMELHFHAGFSYYAAGRLDDAIAAWERTVELQPEFAQPHFQLGIAFEDRGDHQRAVEEYQRALQVNPRYVLAHYNLGHLFKKLDRMDEAVAEFKEAIEKNPNFGDAYNSLAWLYAEKGINLDEGVELVGKALELDPQSAAFWDTLAELHIKKGELDRAREIFRQMISRQPQESFWKERLQQVGG